MSNSRSTQNPLSRVSHNMRDLFRFIRLFRFCSSFFPLSLVRIQSSHVLRNKCDPCNVWMKTQTCKCVYSIFTFHVRPRVRVCARHHEWRSVSRRIKNRSYKILKARTQNGFACGASRCEWPHCTAFIGCVDAEPRQIWLSWSIRRNAIFSQMGIYLYTNSNSQFRSRSHSFANEMAKCERT